MEYILEEITAIFYIAAGVAVLAFGMWLSDLWTGFIDRKVWRQKNRD